MITGRTADCPAGDSKCQDVSDTNLSLVSAICAIVLGWLRGVHWVFECTEGNFVQHVHGVVELLAFLKVKAVKTCMSNFKGDPHTLLIASDVAGLAAALSIGPGASSWSQSSIPRHSDYFAEVVATVLKTTMGKTKKITPWDSMYEEIYDTIQTILPATLSCVANEMMLHQFAPITEKRPPATPPSSRPKRFRIRSKSRDPHRTGVLEPNRSVYDLVTDLLRPL